MFLEVSFTCTGAVYYHLNSRAGAWQEHNPDHHMKISKFCIATEVAAQCFIASLFENPMPVRHWFRDPSALGVTSPTDPSRDNVLRRVHRRIWGFATLAGGLSGSPRNDHPGERMGMSSFHRFTSEHGNEHEHHFIITKETALSCQKYPNTK